MIIRLVERGKWPAWSVTGDVLQTGWVLTKLLWRGRLRVEIDAAPNEEIKKVTGE